MVFYHLRTWTNIWWKIFGQPKTAFEEQSRVAHKKPKTKLVFDNVVPSNWRRFYLLIYSAFDKPSRRRIQVQYLKITKRSSSTVEKIRWKSRSPLFMFKFSLFHVKLDLIVLASPKSTFGNKSALIGLRWKQQYSLKTSVVRKWNRKAAFTP